MTTAILPNSEDISVAPARRNNNNNSNMPYRFDIVALNRMEVDAYQRPLTKFVEEIEKDFNPALVGTICVSERSKTKYAIIDGQTRAEGMRRVGLKEAPCIVYENLTPEQEARLFSDFQTKRRGMTSSSRFKAQVFGKHEVAVAINTVVEEAGFTIDQNTKNNTAIGAVAALEYVFQGAYGGRGFKNRDPELLTQTLLVIKRSWPSLPDTAKGAHMLRGLGRYLANVKEDARFDEERLVTRLSKVTPSDLAKRAESLREGRGMSGRSPEYLAEAIEAQYRKR